MYKFQCGRFDAFYYGETDRHLKVRSGGHIGISPLTFKTVNQSLKSSIRDYALICNRDPSGTNTYLVEIKESLLIKRDEPILNKSISFVSLHLLKRCNMIDKYPLLLIYFIIFGHVAFTLINMYFFVDLQKKLMLENRCSYTQNISEK